MTVESMHYMAWNGLSQDLKATGHELLASAAARSLKSAAVSTEATAGAILTFVLLI
jgi:hypothetical protein